MTDPWANRDYLRGTQYKTDANLAARQSIYAYPQPRIDLAARDRLDTLGPAGGAAGKHGPTGPPTALIALARSRSRTTCAR